MSEKASRSGKDEKEQKYYTQYFMLPVGDFTPKWEEGISTDAPTLYSVDVPIETSYRYRAIRIDEKLISHIPLLAIMNGSCQRPGWKDGIQNRVLHSGQRIRLDTWRRHQPSAH